MANASASSSSSGPVLRRNNFIASSHQRRNNNGSVLRIFFLTLIALVVALSALAVHLSLRVTARQSSSTLSSSSSSSSSSSLLHPPPAADGMHENTRIDTGSSSITQDRVYCMIPFIWNPEIYNAIMETWGKRCDTINFLADSIVGGQLEGDKILDDPTNGYKPYYDYPEGTFPSNVVFINMTRSWFDCENDSDDEGGKSGEVKKVCRHIWEKMWRSWVYVEEHHLDQAEWFCKVDYDTYFFPDNLKYFVRHKNWNPYTEYHYFGHLIQHRTRKDAPMIVGAAVCWSRKTLDDIADVYRTMPKGSKRGERGRCEDRAHATEEVTTSQCLREHLNVTAYAARDEELREYITIDDYARVLTWNRTEQGEWWFWRGKPQGAGDMENAIAIRPIGLHKYKKPDQIRELEETFFGPADSKVISRLKPVAKTYVKKVRKAMGVDEL